MRHYTWLRQAIMVIGFGSGLLLTAWGQSHPRGLLTATTQAEVVARLSRPPYQGWYQQLRATVAALPARPPADMSLYERAYAATDLAFCYVLSQEPAWAAQAYTYLETVLSDSLYTDAEAFGLTRALAVQQTALCYDFAYGGWTPAQRTQVNAALLAGLVSVHASMGFAANYNLASNWMGVRYGAVVLASCVYDPPPGAARNPALPYRWDAQKRLQDHLEAVIYAGGWHGESMGYFAYDWSFCGPALIALQHAASGPHFALATWMPRLLPTMRGLAAAAVTLPAAGVHQGLKPDFSDDNLVAMGAGGWALALRLYPAAQQPYLREIFDYRFGAGPLPTGRSGLLHSLLFYPDSLPPEDPATAGWCHYHDPEQGIVIWRDRYRDSADVVFALSATGRRVRGHQGPDTHTWRLLGLGVPWVIGGGRTGMTGLQTNFFPAAEATPARSTEATGRLRHIETRPGGGTVWSEGSCLGLADHQRQTIVDYRGAARATLLMTETATEGRRWRIQTPEFVRFEAQPDGYLLTAPHGASLRIHLLSPHGEISTGLHRYGGDTERHNSGIPWGGTSYAQSRWIDVACTGYLRVVMTLQEAGQPHPQVSQDATGRVQVGQVRYYPE